MSGIEPTIVDLQPVLKGARVLIRPIVATDWTGLYKAASDPAVWEQHPARNRYQEPVFRDFFEAALASGSGFTLIHRADGNIMGSTRYHGHDGALREIEIGWSLLSCEYWGGSYNLEIKNLLLSHAFKFVDTVVFWVGDTNIRSQRAMEKIGGMRRAGIHTRTVAGIASDNIVYEIRKKNFQQSRQAGDQLKSAVNTGESDQ